MTSSQYHHHQPYTKCYVLFSTQIYEITGVINMDFNVLNQTMATYSEYIRYSGKGYNIY